MIARITRVLLVAAATFALIELLLQIGAVVVWLTFSSPAEPDRGGGGRVVMCLGDSFTFGLGASAPEQAWPAVLERLLRERLGTDWSVVNHGWPGQDSGLALERLPAQLRSRRPDVVCVLLGGNDLWAHPNELDVGAAVDTAPGAPRFRLIWRTGRLARWLWNAVTRETPDTVSGRDGDLDADAPPDPTAMFVGAWRYLGKRVVFAADGTAVYRDVSMRWHADARTLRLIPEAGPELVLTWRRSASRVFVTPLAGGDEAVLQRLDRFVDAHSAAAENARARGDLRMAERLLHECILGSEPGDPWLPRLHGDLAAVFHAQDRGDQVDVELAWLRDAARTAPDPATLGALVEALAATGRHDEAAPFADRLRTEHDGNARALRALALWRHANGDATGARGAIGRALEALDGSRHWQATVHRMRAMLYRDYDEDEACRSLVRAWTLDRGADWIRREIARSPDGAARVAAAGRTMGLEGRQRDDLDKLLAERDDPMHAVLRSHLAQIVALARNAGAETFLASYPYDWPFYDVLRNVVRDTGARFVPVHEAFARARRAEPDRELFVADGHCNDAGYRILAEEFARAIIAR